MPDDIFTQVKKKQDIFSRLVAQKPKDIFARLKQEKDQEPPASRMFEASPVTTTEPFMGVEEQKKVIAEIGAPELAEALGLPQARITDDEFQERRQQLLNTIAFFSAPMEAYYQGIKTGTEDVAAGISRMRQNAPYSPEYITGGLQAVAGGARAALAIATPGSGGLRAFALASPVVEAISPEAAEYMAPVQKLTKPDTEIGRYLAELGDLALIPLVMESPRLARIVKGAAKGKPIPRADAAELERVMEKYNYDRAVDLGMIEIEKPAPPKAEGPQIPKVGEAEKREFTSDRAKVIDISKTTEGLPSLLVDERGQPIPVTRAREAQAPLTEAEQKLFPLEAEPIITERKPGETVTPKTEIPVRAKFDTEEQLRADLKGIEGTPEHPGELSGLVKEYSGPLRVNENISSRGYTIKEFKEDGTPQPWNDGDINVKPGESFKAKYDALVKRFVKGEAKKAARTAEPDFVSSRMQMTEGAKLSEKYGGPEEVPGLNLTQIVAIKMKDGTIHKAVEDVSHAELYNRLKLKDSEIESAGWMNEKGEFVSEAQFIEHVKGLEKAAEPPPSALPKIVAVAYKIGGKVYKGKTAAEHRGGVVQTHGSLLNEVSDQVFKQYQKDSGPEGIHEGDVEGFVDSRGEFISRNEASRLLGEGREAHVYSGLQGTGVIGKGVPDVVRLPDRFTSAEEAAQFGRENPELRAELQAKSEKHLEAMRATQDVKARVTEAQQAEASRKAVEAMDAEAAKVKKSIEEAKESAPAIPEGLDAEKVPGVVDYATAKGLLLADQVAKLQKRELRLLEQYYKVSEKYGRVEDWDALDDAVTMSRQRIEAAEAARETQKAAIEKKAKGRESIIKVEDEWKDVPLTTEKPTPAKLKEQKAYLLDKLTKADAIAKRHGLQAANVENLQAEAGQLSKSVSRFGLESEILRLANIRKDISKALKGVSGRAEVISDLKKAGFDIRDDRILIRVPGDGEFLIDVSMIGDAIARAQDFPVNIASGNVEMGPRGTTAYRPSRYKDGTTDVMGGKYTMIGGRVMLRGKSPKGYKSSGLDAIPATDARAKNVEAWFADKGTPTEKLGYAFKGETGETAVSQNPIPPEGKQATHVVFRSGNKYYTFDQAAIELAKTNAKEPTFTLTENGYLQVRDAKGEVQGVLAGSIPIEGTRGPFTAKQLTEHFGESFKTYLEENLPTADISGKVKKVKDVLNAKNITGATLLALGLSQDDEIRDWTLTAAIPLILLKKFPLELRAKFEIMDRRIMAELGEGKITMGEAKTRMDALLKEIGEVDVSKIREEQTRKKESGAPTTASDVKFETSARMTVEERKNLDRQMRNVDKRVERGDIGETQARREKERLLRQQDEKLDAEEYAASVAEKVNEAIFGKNSTPQQKMRAKAIFDAIPERIRVDIVRQEVTRYLKDKLSVWARGAGVAGTEQGLRLLEGDLQLHQHEQFYRPHREAIADIYKKVKNNPWELERIGEATSRALEDRANAAKYLDTPEKRVVYEHQKAVFDYFMAEASVHGHAVLEDYFPHAQQVDIWDQIFGKVADKPITSPLRETITADSPHLRAREDVLSNWRKDPLQTLDSYVSSVSKTLAYESAIDFAASGFERALSPSMKKSGMDLAHDMVKATLKPKFGTSKTLRVGSFIRRAQYHSYLFNHPIKAAVNYTQAMLSRLWLSEKGAALADRTWHESVSPYGPKGVIRGELAIMLHMLNREIPFKDLVPVTAKDVNMGSLAKKMSEYDTFMMAEGRNWKKSHWNAVMDVVARTPGWEQVLKKNGGNEMKAVDEMLQNPDTFKRAFRFAQWLANRVQVSPSISSRASFNDIPVVRLLAAFKNFNIRLLQELRQSFRGQEGPEGMQAQKLLAEGMSDGSKMVEVLREVNLKRQWLEKAVAESKKRGEKFHEREGVQELLREVKAREAEIQKVIAESAGTTNGMVAKNWMKFFAATGAIQFIGNVLSEMVYDTIYNEETDEERVQRAAFNAMWQMSPMPFRSVFVDQMFATAILPRTRNMMAYGITPRTAAMDIAPYALYSIPGIGIVERVSGRRISRSLIDYIAPKKEPERGRESRQAGRR